MKKTYEDYIELSKDKKVIFLDIDNNFPKSTKTNTKTKCETCEHIWFPNYDRLKTKHCPNCAGNAKRIRQDYIDLENEKDIIFLELEDVLLKNSNTRTLIKCKICQYEWHSRFCSLANHKCPNCVGQAKITFEDVSKLLEERNITYLSGEVKNSKSSLKLKCNVCNYFFTSTYYKIKQNTFGGCKCSPIFPKSYDDYIELGIIKKVTFLDINKNNIPQSTKHKTNVRCNVCDYKWRSSYVNLNSADNCPNCINKARVTIDDYKKLEKVKDIVFPNLESDFPQNIDFKTKIVCLNCQTTWETSYTKLKHSNSGCPTCAGGRGERVARKIIENVFKESFPKIRPNWLINPVTGYRLELDGYCQNLNLAFEYQGSQHFKVIKKFKNNNIDLKTQKERDLIKIKLCEEYNVKLIIINEFKYFTKKYILDEMKSALNGLVDEEIIEEAVDAQP